MAFPRKWLTLDPLRFYLCTSFCTTYLIIMTWDDMWPFDPPKVGGNWEKPLVTQAWWTMRRLENCSRHSLASKQARNFQFHGRNLLTICHHAAKIGFVLFTCDAAAAASVRREILTFWPSELNLRINFWGVSTERKVMIFSSAWLKRNRGNSSISKDKRSP